MTIVDTEIANAHLDIRQLCAKLDLVLKQQRELLDRQAIRDCLNAYCRGLDRMDSELTLSAYHPDAVDDHGGVVAHPRSFVAWANFSHAQQAMTHHMITNHHCEIDGDVAHAESYFFAVLKSATSEEVTLAGGRYVDRFERRAGNWKIAARKCIVEWGGTPASEPLTEAARQLHNRGSRDRSDPSYARPFAIDPAKLAQAAAYSHLDRIDDALSGEGVR